MKSIDLKDLQNTNEEKMTSGSFAPRLSDNFFNTNDESISKCPTFDTNFLNTHDEKLIVEKRVISHP